MTTQAAVAGSVWPLSQQPIAWLTERRWNAWMWAFVGLGVALRLLRFLLRFPLWGDECFVALNFMDRGYAGLAEPLEFNQICPLWFMWIEMTAVKALGFNEWSLRLFPTIYSVVCVFLFRHLARGLLNPLPALLAVAIFCVSYYPIRHGAELKPYSADLMVALAMLALAANWLQTGRGRFGWWLVAFVPVGLGLSYTAPFVAGGVSAAVLLALATKRLPRGWLAWAAFNGLVLATFLAFYVAVAREQSLAAKAGGIHDYWAKSFPPLSTPWRVPLWLLDMHTGRMFAYPVGGTRGASAFTTLLCLAGAAVLWKRQEKWISCLLLGPAALGLAAAFIHAYPYGESARITQYLAPAICLLAGLGLATLLTLPKSKLPVGRKLAAAVAVLLAIGAGSAVRDLTKPYKTEFDALNQCFARWIWHDLAYDGEVACIQGDLGVPLFPGEAWRAGALEYRCYQRIFSPLHRHGPHLPDWTKITANHPLWCVTYAHEGHEPDAAALAAWLGQMNEQYDLASTMRLPLGSGGGDIFEQWYEVYRFVPKTSSRGTIQAQTPAAQPLPVR